MSKNQNGNQPGSTPSSNGGVPQNKGASRQALPPQAFKRPKIGIVGHSRAGKTTFLAVLQSALQVAGWSVTFDAPAGSSEEVVKQYRDSYNYVVKLVLWTSRGFFPAATPIEEEPNFVCCVVSRGDKSFELEFYDPAGQVFTTYAQGKYPEVCDNIAKSIKQCDGVVALFDQDADDTSWTDSWNQIARNIHTDSREGGKYKGPKLALCIAKTDESNLQRRFRVRNARSWMEKRKTWLIQSCASKKLEYACFFVSAVGWKSGMSNVRYFVDSEPIDFDANNILNAVDPNALQIPDPAISKAYTKSQDAQNNPVDVNKEMRNFPIFTNPLQLVEHDFETNPIFDSGPKMLNLDNQKDFDENKRIRGVHIGFGLSDPGRRSQRHDGLNESIYRPWNIAQPILWLANMLSVGDK